ncbi:MAG: nucleotidyl transferase AbiEii/AbiGii toxin family protein [Candidatus Shapirobacteria bacterium]
MAKSILSNFQKQILAVLAKDVIFIEKFYLTDGTALAEFYLHHRLSEDLDFFGEQEVDETWLTSLTKKIKQKLNLDKSEIQQSFNRHLVFFEKGSQVIKTEFTYFPFEPVAKRKAVGDLKIDSVLDMAVNKFFTIYQKPAPRHFIDLYLIVKKYGFSWLEIRKMAKIKFDTDINLLQLGGQLLVVKETGGLPKMLIDLPVNEWQEYFLNRARELEKEIRK